MAPRQLTCARFYKHVTSGSLSKHYVTSHPWICCAYAFAVLMHWGDDGNSTERLSSIHTMCLQAHLAVFKPAARRAPVSKANVNKASTYSAKFAIGNASAACMPAKTTVCSKV